MDALGDYEADLDELLCECPGDVETGSRDTCTIACLLLAMDLRRTGS